MEITNDMRNYYMIRTNNHIKNVCNVFLKIIEHIELEMKYFDDIYFNICNHDKYKFSEEEMNPYTIFSWKMKNGEKLTSSEQKEFDKAWKHHYTNETHHPERHGGDGVFSKVECVEIFCDLQAMSIEFNEGSCRKFFENEWTDKLKYYKDDERLKVESYIRYLITTWESL